MEIEESMSEKRTLCFYHGDMDGRCSAAIVRKAVGEEVEFIAMDYGDPIPWDLVSQASKIIIVDFSFPLHDMEKIRSLVELIWIDHHVTALTDLQSLKDIPGVRSLERLHASSRGILFFRMIRYHRRFCT